MAISKLEDPRETMAMMPSQVSMWFCKCPRVERDTQECDKKNRPGLLLQAFPPVFADLNYSGFSKGRVNPLPEEV